MARMLRNAIIVALLGTARCLSVTKKTTNTSVVVSSQKDVDAERPKLEKMATMLGAMLKGDSLAHSKIAPALKLFAANLESVLNKTKSMKPADAMPQLVAAKSGVADLVNEMTRQQQSLMKDDIDQQDGLLLGVLMVHKADTMSNQLAILAGDDFSGLDVSKDLLRDHDNKTSLYIQAARYLDEHKNASGVLLKPKAGVDRKEAMALVLDKRVAALEKDQEQRDVMQRKRIEDLTALAKKGGKDAKHAQAWLKKEEHTYKKWSAQSKHDITSMKSAAAAVRSGDTAALNRARAALTKSLEALKNKNGGMIVFLQQSNTLLEQDCPYCAAQCVEKCHNKGDPYVTCLGECADAGKQ